MGKIVNVAIQVLPEGNKKQAYSIIDKVIKLIRKSGIVCYVCPFETVVEGKYEEIMKLVKKIPEICYHNGAENVLINLKIQISRNKDVTIISKLDKYVQ